MVLNVWFLIYIVRFEFIVFYLELISLFFRIFENKGLYYVFRSVNVLRECLFSMSCICFFGFLD